jgi:hypothetical protein
MLHIRCGDDILENLNIAGLPGEKIRWANALCQGPTPDGLGPEEWRRVRAKHAEGFYGMPFQQGWELLRRQDENLDRAHDHNEVVLWFEHDLFDQIVLIYLLHWFVQRNLETKSLWLVCPDRHIGNMTPEELSMLFDGKSLVTSSQYSIARRAWTAFCAADPSAIVSLMANDDTSPLPHLDPAFRRHLQEFPSVENGLGWTEETALQIIAEGVTTPLDIFRALQRREERFWLGDAMFWPYLQALATVKNPLLRVEGAGPWPNRETPNSARKVFITDTGEAVLKGQRDHIALNGIDPWLGGVHLQGHDVRWRWDRDRQGLRHIH